MAKIVFMFPGQGAQYIGMGKQVAEKFAKADAVFNEASEALGIDMKRLVFDGNEDELKITENTQPAILTASIACMQPLLDAGIKPDAAAGLSLGEYCAHVAAGTFTFSEAVKLVRIRGRIMQEAVPAGIGAMAAIIGLDRCIVEECCCTASSTGIVEPANYNCPGQIVISGELKAVEKAAALCSEKGAKRALMLPVSAPFHCSLMKPAGERLAKELDKIKFYEMAIPVVTNVTADFVSSKEEIKDLLVRQVSTSVKMEDSIVKMIEAGYDTFIEIGPGKVLSGFIRKINRDVKILNVEDIASLENTILEIGR